MADTLESLEIEVKHNASNAAGDIQALADSIGHLKTNLSGVSGEMKALAGAIKSVNTALKGDIALKIENIAGAFKVFDNSTAWLGAGNDTFFQLVNSLSLISNIKFSEKQFENLANGILHLSTGLRLITEEDIAKIERLCDALQKLSGVDLKGVSSALNAIGRTRSPASDDGPQGYLNLFQMIGNAARKTASTIKTAFAPIGGFLKGVFNGVISVVKKLTSLLGKLFNAVKKVVSGVAKLAVGGITKWFENMRDSVKSVLNPLDKLFSSLSRIAFYRLIRSAIKAVTDALKEGSDNAYFFAKNFGNATKYIADAMDSLKSAHFKMSNQLGAAWNTLLATITPIVIQIIRMVTKAAEVITQFFAVISGSGTYLKAKDYTHAWADETEKGAKAAKEWKNQLMGFDEINRLEEPSDSSRGTPDKYTDYENMFEEASVKSWIKDLVNMLKGGEFERVGKLLGDKFNSLVSGFDWKGWGAKIGKGIQGGIDFAYSFLKTADFRNVGKSLANFLDSLGDQIDFKKAGRLATRLKTAIWDILYGAFTNPGSMGKLARNISDFVLGALEELADWLDSLDPIAVANAIRDFFDNIKGEEIKNAFVRVVKTAWEKTVTLKEELFPDGLLPTITKNIVEFVKKIPWADIKKALLECYEQLKSTVKEVFDIIWPKDERDAFVENLKDKIQEVFQKAIKKIDLAVIHNILAYKLDEAIFGEDAAKKMWYNKGDFAGRELILGTEYGIMREKQALDDTVKGYVTDPVSEALYEVEKTGRESGNALARAMAKGTSDSSRSIGSLKADISRDASNIKSNMSKVSGSAKDVTKEMQSMQSRGSGFMRNLASSANTYSRNIVSGLSNVIAKARDAFNSLSSLSSTKFSASVTPGKVKKYASGGFVEEGPFYMNHGEIAGKFSNGRTAVANSNMITDGIENATYRAMTEALSSQNQNRGNGTVVLNVNGREFMRAIYSDMKAVSKEKGVSLISNFA
jgi:phage-related protein